MRLSRALAGLLVGGGLLWPASQSFAQELIEAFDVAPPVGWQVVNNSTTVGATSVFQGNAGVFPAQAGAPTAYAGMNSNATTGTNTISVWLISPPRVGIQNGDQWSFFTRTVNTPQFPDRLEFRMSTNGATCNPGTGSASTGDFATLLVTVNPGLTLAGYPNVWTFFQGQLSGIAGSVTGCFAFRYFVTGGGPTGLNSDYIGIDTFRYGILPVELMSFSVE